MKIYRMVDNNSLYSYKKQKREQTLGAFPASPSEDRGVQIMTSYSYCDFSPVSQKSNLRLINLLFSIFQLDRLTWVFLRLTVSNIRPKSLSPFILSSQDFQP